MEDGGKKPKITNKETMCRWGALHFQKSAKALRIDAQITGDKERMKGNKQTIWGEEQKRKWYLINRAVDDPRLGATLKVQKW